MNISLLYIFIIYSILFHLTSLIVSAFEAGSKLEETPLSYDPLKINWPSLSYNKYDFLCTHYEPLCNNYLDQIACSESNRTVSACGSSGKLVDYNGACICNGDPVFYDATGRVSEELIDNRIKGDVGWMLEPWADGPPYSLRTSYNGVCQLVLHRLGCDTSDFKIVYGNQSTSWACECGSYDAASTRVGELVVDTLNDALLTELVVFQDPIHLSIELSIAVMVLVGKLSSIVAAFLYLPPIIGFLLGGIAIQDIISPSLIKGAGGNGPHATPFGEIKTFALIIVIMRAGLSLKPREILARGYMTLALSILPYFVEFAIILRSSQIAFDWSAVDAGLLASILAALSPSLVIPGMIKLVDEKLGYTPRNVLTSAPIEVVLAIILYGIFSNLEQGFNPIYFWVKPLPLYANILLIPVNIGFSFILGSIGAFMIIKYTNFRETCAIKRVNEVLSKNIAEYLFFTISICYLLYALCQVMYIQQTSGIVAVFSMTLCISEFGNKDLVEQMKSGLSGLWVFVEVFLFTETGISLATTAKTGPLQSQRAFSGSRIGAVVGVLLLGTLGRSVAILGLVLAGYYTLAPHRRNINYILLWWISTWMFQIPKGLFGCFYYIL